MKAAFWNTVIDCLVEFFDVSHAEASARVKELVVLEEENAPRGPFNDLTYHADPIHIASDMMHGEVDYSSLFYEKYKVLQEKNLRRRSKSQPVSIVDQYFAARQAQRRAQTSDRIERSFQKTKDSGRRKNTLQSVA